ncbi:unnamed protein product (macronuclear) [Paramecium tetraurelia]|uniref:Uncharacterized protein n=1 Tax=Paramecium tetraurelia TaxID=5888 RepID=A0BQF0_PARTE|nr:uncharacterized protein GSPATT00030996001 [Paramecium tetraurelia]CAK60767.1 unnamed protein product [Paramecium tetraurelia]|eukprot:XP_001428165.1 hypothetical protein (macronuclear) [Paramecium tetraurelia strain d4-2]
MFKFGLDFLSKKSLPQDFADQILKLEMEIDSNEQTQLSQLQQLISLYMIGIEYYESIQDKRSFFFQKKLNALILFTTQRENEEFLLSKEQIINKRAKFEEESKRIELDLIYSQTESKEAQVKEIVNNHTNQVKQIQTMIQNEMASQTDTFQMRLERRRKSKIARSLSQTEIDLESYNTTIPIKKTEFKEQGCIKIAAQTKQIILEEDDSSRKHSFFQLEKDSIENELLQETKLKQQQKHQRYGSQIPLSNISIKQRFLSQEFNETQEVIEESSQKEIQQENP